VSGGSLIVTIPAAYAAAASSVAIGATGTNSTNSITLAAATSSLAVGAGGLTVSRPNGNNKTVELDVNAGTVTVSGAVSFTDNGNTTATRIALILITTGTMTVTGNLTFNTPAAATAASNVINMSGGAGTFNLGGAFTVTNGVGTLTSSATSTFNYNGSVAQTMPIGVSAIVYNNLYVNNTNANGAIPSAAIT